MKWLIVLFMVLIPSVAFAEAPIGTHASANVEIVDTGVKV